MNIGDMKCCGNCLHRYSISMGDYSREDCDLATSEDTDSSEVCTNWKFDKLNYRKRFAIVQI